MREIATVERFSDSLEREDTRRRNYHNHDDAGAAVFDYIERFYKKGARSSDVDILHRPRHQIDTAAFAQVPFVQLGDNLQSTLR